MMKSKKLQKVKEIDMTQGLVCRKRSKYVKNEDICRDELDYEDYLADDLLKDEQEVDVVFPAAGVDGEEKDPLEDCNSVDCLSVPLVIKEEPKLKMKTKKKKKKVKYKINVKPIKLEPKIEVESKIEAKKQKKKNKINVKVEPHLVVKSKVKMKKPKVKHKINVKPIVEIEPKVEKEPILSFEVKTVVDCGFQKLVVIPKPVTHVQNNQDKSKFGDVEEIRSSLIGVTKCNPSSQYVIKEGSVENRKIGEHLFTINSETSQPITISNGNRDVQSKLQVVTPTCPTNGNQVNQPIVKNSVNVQTRQPIVNSLGRLDLERRLSGTLNPTHIMNCGQMNQPMVKSIAGMRNVEGRFMNESSVRTCIQMNESVANSVVWGNEERRLSNQQMVVIDKPIISVINCSQMNQPMVENIVRVGYVENNWVSESRVGTCIQMNQPIANSVGWGGEERSLVNKFIIPSQIINLSQTEQPLVKSCLVKENVEKRLLNENPPGWVRNSTQTTQPLIIRVDEEMGMTETRETLERELPPEKRGEPEVEKQNIVKRVCGICGHKSELKFLFDHMKEHGKTTSPSLPTVMPKKLV